MKSDKYILWDWNGTLLDDTFACIDTLNQMLASRGLETVTPEFFRRNFAFPARSFYELVGMDVPDDQWDALAFEYHECYHRHDYTLNPDALAALEFARANAAGESIISALHQRFLDAETERFGVKPFMDHVFGTDNLDGGSKLERARELLAELAVDGHAADRLVLIGDSLHDHQVAEELGISAVLFSGGSHDRERLAAVAPTGDTLSECIALALGL